ncbi:MAG TPA: UvrY/SirA/GacA family response regulator transcription factor [Gammaproteobacteria bacterium]|nr:UvrY/SirA/GacA family response regulator transcription factor [Gammaproteobacteria bacterium]HQZ88256.1 UvrY/SirA/GacA family response regulator transcription factor [Gammaproteobacteria bacterium]HRA43269.1 UvrY/SirA/GacA family response regulator transcription factor [Gammaproteobacteria bacterium]
MINVLVVDDHDLVRSGIVRLLSDIAGITVVGEANTGEEAVKIAREKRPNVVLMDIRMPGIGGLEATRKIVHQNPEIKVIALTIYENEPFPTKLLQAGASGYLTKGALIDEMVLAIRTVYAGNRYLGPEIAQQMALKSVAENEQSPFEQLSERELQVMIMITAGQSVQTIAEKLCVTPKTINSYRYRIFEKLNVQSDVELTLLAMRHGILETETT